MRIRMLVVALLFAASQARAWEVGSPADIQHRINELQQAWEGKTPSQIAQDKLARSKQPKRPGWVDRKAWKLELGQLTYYFAVGRAPAATDSTPLQPGTPSTSQAGATAIANGRSLDWYYDESAGAMYTLVVDAR